MSGQGDNWESVPHLHNHYIETLVAVKAGLSTIADGQKALYEHISRNSDEQTRQLATIAADIRVMRERFSNIEMRSMMVTYKKNGDGNGHSDQASNGSKDKGKSQSKKDITESLETEEDFDREMMYRHVGKFMSSNWKFLLIVSLLAVAGVVMLFGPEWASWMRNAPIKTP